VVGIAGDVRVREWATERTAGLPALPPGGGRRHHQLPPKDLVIARRSTRRRSCPRCGRSSRAPTRSSRSQACALAEVVADDTAPRSVQVRVLAGFAAVAHPLAGIGIHGLLAFTVSAAAGFGCAWPWARGPRICLVLKQGVLLPWRA
jgi:hypothetical protein